MSATVEGQVVDAGEAIERRRVELRNAADRYINGQISIEEYEALEAKLMPDYDAMGRHLYKISLEGNTTESEVKRSMWARFLDLLTPPRHPRKAS